LQFVASAQIRTLMWPEINEEIRSHRLQDNAVPIGDLARNFTPVA